MPTQYVACKFRVQDTRTYTYHNDGAPVAPGDQVKVADARGADDAWKRVFMVSVSDRKPDYPTKPILGLAPLETPTTTADDLFGGK